MLLIGWLIDYDSYLVAIEALDYSWDALSESAKFLAICWFVDLSILWIGNEVSIFH